MPDIQLHDYVAKIKNLIRTSLQDDAIAHCQHILRQYPKHVETYCLLGEACLEKRMYREATEFFQRTLSADPENLIARVGLAVIYEEQGALAEAIWQMEQAFELAPGNAEVRRELQRLYTQRDGVEKSRLKLTRGALGRLYIRNGLYERAVTEFRAILREEPDLPGARVSLIEALWREGRRMEAVETCLDLLEALPYCLKANLFLGEIWLHGDNEEAGQEKLSIAKELDPENLVAQELMGKDSPLPREQVLLGELDVMAGVLSALDLGRQPPVEETRPPVEEVPVQEIEEPWTHEGEVPDWLEAMGLAGTEEEAVGLETVEEQAPEPSAAEEMPEWFSELTARETIYDEEGSTAETETVAAEEMPDWLKEMGAADTTQASEPAEAEAHVGEEVPASAEEEPILEEAGAEMPADEFEVQPSEAVPDWLERLQGEEAAEVGEAELEAPAEEAPAEEVPDWLLELGEPMVPEESVPVEAPDEEMPDWLLELRMPEEEATAVAPLAEEAPEAVPEESGEAVQEEVPAALPGEVAPEKAPPTEQVAAAEEEEEPRAKEVPTAEAAAPGEVPDSLKALVDAGILDDADLEAAMSEMSAEELEAQRAEAIPDWLQELMGEEPAEAEEAEAPPEKVPIDELPDWVLELGGPAALADTETVQALDEELPEWLLEFRASADEEASSPPVGEEAAPPLAKEKPISEEAPAAVEHEPAPEGEPEASVSPGPQEQPEALPVGAAGREAPQKDAVPDWLQELMEEEEAAEAQQEPESIAEASKEEAEEAPGWLLELEELEAEEELSVEPSTPEQNIPQWLREFHVADTEDVVPPSVEEAASAEAATPETAIPAGEGEPEAGAPGWLQELMVEESAPSEVQAPPEAEVELPPEEEPQEVSAEAEVSEPEPVPAETPGVDKAAPPSDIEMAAPLDRVSVERVETIPQAEKPAAPPVPSAAPPTAAKMAAPFERVEVEEKVAASSQVTELLAHLKSKPRDHRARMELARLYTAESDWNAALDEYEKLISSRKLLPDTIEALLVLREEQVDHAKHYQLLGDAYMQNDQLDEALEAYRLARQALVQR